MNEVLNVSTTERPAQRAVRLRTPLPEALRVLLPGADIRPAADDPELVTVTGHPVERLLAIAFAHRLPVQELSPAPAA